MVHSGSESESKGIGVDSDTDPEINQITIYPPEQLLKFLIKYWGRRLDTMEAEMLYEELSGTVIGAAMEAHKLLGSGFLESVYEHALALELTGRQKPFERQVPITVMYKQAQAGEYRGDFLVDGKIIL